MNNWGCSQPPFPIVPRLPPGPHPDSLSLEEEENRLRRPNVVLHQSPTLDLLSYSVGPKFFGEPPPQPNYSSGWGRGYRYRWAASPPPFLPNAPHENQSVDLNASPRQSIPEYPDSPISDSRKRSGQVSPNTYSRVSPDTSFSAPTKPTSQPNVTERSFLSDLMEGLKPLSPCSDISSVDSSSSTPSPSMVVQTIQHSSVSSSETRQMLDDIGAAESISSNCEETGREENRFANLITETLDNKKEKRKAKEDSHDKLHQTKRKSSDQFKVMGRKRSRHSERVTIEWRSRSVNSKTDLSKSADGIFNGVRRVAQDLGSISSTNSSKDRQRSRVTEGSSGATNRREERTPKALGDPISPIQNLELPAERRDRVLPTEKKLAGTSVTLHKSKKIKNPETNTTEITVQEPEKYSHEETEAVDASFDCDQAREAAVSLSSQEFVKEVKGLLAAEEEEASLAKKVRFNDSSSTLRVLVVKEPVLTSTSLEYLYENSEELVKSSQPEEDCLELVWNNANKLWNTAFLVSSSHVRAIERNLPVSNNNSDKKLSGEVFVELQTTVSTSLSDPYSVQNGTDQQDSSSQDSLGIKKQQKAGIQSSVEDLASDRMDCPERGNGKEASISIASAGSVMESTSTHMEPTNTTEAASCQDENVDLIVVASIASEPKVTELCISPPVSTSQEGQDLVIGTQPEIDISTQVLDMRSAPSLPYMLQTSENLDYGESVAAVIDSVMKKMDCNANVELTSIKGRGKYSTHDSRKVHLKEASSGSSVIQDIEESSSNNEDSLHLEPQLLDHSCMRKDVGRESNAKDDVTELEPDVTFGRWCGHTQRHLLLNWVDDFDLTGRKSSSVLSEEIKEIEEVLVPNLSTVKQAIQVDDERTCTEFSSSEYEIREEEIRIFEEMFRNEKCATKGFTDGEANPKRQEDEQINDEQLIENPVVASLIDRELKEIEDFVMPFEQAFEEEKPCSKEDCSSMVPLVAICVEALRDQGIQDQEIIKLLAEDGNPDLLSFATNLLESQPFIEADNESPAMEVDLSARNLSEETSPSEQERSINIVPEFDREEETTELESHITSTINERENPHEKEEISVARLDVLNAVGQEQTLLDAADIPRDEANADERDSKVKVPRVHTATTYFLGDLHKLKSLDTHIETKRKKNLLWTASALRRRSASPVTESSPSACSQEMSSQRAQKPNRSSSPQKPLLGIEKPVIPSTFVEPKPTSPDLIHHACTSISTRAATSTIAIVDKEPVVSSPQSSFRLTENGEFNLSDTEDDEEILVTVSAGAPPSRPLSPLFATNVHGVRRRAHSPQVSSSILSEKAGRVTIASSAVSANGFGFGGTKKAPVFLRSAKGNWFRVTGLEPCLPVPGHKTQKSPVVTSRAPEPKCKREYSCSEPDERGKITVRVKELLDWPGRLKRDKNIVVIMRGLPGSGKSYAAKLIRAKELSMGGCAPRILSINDYFYFDTVANAPVVKMRSMYPKTWEYRHDPSKEIEYRVSLAERFKKLVDNSFKRQLELVDDGASIVILDDVNAKSDHYEELARFAYYRGYHVLVAECTASLQTCQERSRAHQRSLKDIRTLALTWEETPVRWPRLDLCWLLTTQIPFRQRRISEEAEMVDDSLLLDLHLCNGYREQEVEDNSTVEK